MVYLLKTQWSRLAAFGIGHPISFYLSEIIYHTFPESFPPIQPIEIDNLSDSHNCINPLDQLSPTFVRSQTGGKGREKHFTHMHRNEAASTCVANGAVLVPAWYSLAPPRFCCAGASIAPFSLHGAILIAAALAWLGVSARTQWPACPATCP